MKVVVLCGGLGTRLREETEFRPKPLVDIGGRPILWHIMKTYAHYGFREFVLCLGYRGNMIKEYFLNYEAMNNDFTICLGQKFHVHYNGSHQEQQFQVTLAETGSIITVLVRLKLSHRNCRFCFSDHGIVNRLDSAVSMLKKPSPRSVLRLPVSPASASRKPARAAAGSVQRLGPPPAPGVL